MEHSLADFAAHFAKRLAEANLFGYRDLTEATTKARSTIPMEGETFGYKTDSR
jgi:hypothetical protein